MSNIMKKSKTELSIKNDSDNINKLYTKVSKHIENARQRIQTAIDTEMVTAYWLSGRDIIEEEQNGSERAAYGTFLLQSLSEKLTAQYGKGFSISTLKDMRRFYLIYQNYAPISHAVRGESQLTFSSKLGWSHYRALMRVKRPEARRFYEIEAESNNWAGRVLERQINSLLYDRLAKSRDKAGLIRLATKGQEINKPEDAIKEPMVLEFLNIPESNKLVESKFEEALISNLQHFLLELGKGFAFIARQKRLTLDGKHYRCDLVFYHVILKCYCVVDIKVEALTHADLGQMLLYVNYFDKEIKLENDNPTIGLILCTEKSEEMAKYVLNDSIKPIFASTYQLYLPSDIELEAELKKEIEEIKYKLEHKKTKSNK